MKRRGFLKTLAGLCGVAVVPAVPVVRAATPIEKTHILPMPMERPCDAYMDLSEVINRGMEKYRTEYRYHQYGYQAVLRDGSYRFEKVG